LKLTFYGFFKRKLHTDCLGASGPEGIKPKHYSIRFFTLTGMKLYHIISLLPSAGLYVIQLPIPICLWKWKWTHISS